MRYFSEQFATVGAKYWRWDSFSCLFFYTRTWWQQNHQKYF